MRITTYKRVKQPKRKRIYLPLQYAIRKGNAAKVFTIQSALSAVLGASQLAMIQSQPIPFGATRYDRALLVVESIKNTGEAILSHSKQLKKVY